MAETKHIVITGATGFIGQHLLEDLLPLNYHVTIITRNPSKAMRVKSEKITILKADLTDLDSLTLAFKGADVLINLAAELRNMNVISATNIEGTQNIVDAALANNIKHIIHLSSVGVVGMQYSLRQIETNEETICQPKNEYERTKLESEQILKKATDYNKLSLTILRPSNVFGEHHQKKALLHLFTKLNSAPFFGCSKHAVANYVYVKDVTGAILRLIQQPELNGVYNIGESVKLDTFVQFITKITGKAVRVIFLSDLIFSFINLFGITKLRPLSNAVCYSDKKLKGIMNYSVGVEEGLKRTFEYYRSLLQK